MLSRRLILPLFAAASAYALAATPTTADIIELKDGRSLSGAMSRDGNTVLILLDAPPEGSPRTITTTPDQVVHVLLTSNLTPAQLADSEWTRTAALIQKSGDLAAIIDLHRKFLDRYPDQPISAGVRASLAEYQKLDRLKSVRFRGHWMPAVQVEITLRTWHDIARPAIEHYRAGYLREAFESANQILSSTPDNPETLAIAGLASYRLGNLATSREYFSKLSAVDPSSTLAENNLALIAARQNIPSASLLHYTRALERSPASRLLLDNIIEALVAYTGRGGDIKSEPFRNLVHPFEQAETRMEADLARTGLYRWGSTWVDKDQFAGLSGNRHAIQAAMSDLDARYHDHSQTLSITIASIIQAATDHNNTLSEINFLNNYIQAQQFAGPVVFDALARRDNLMLQIDMIRARKLALENQRDQLIVTLGSFADYAVRLRTVLNASDSTLYNGVQRLMELGEDLNPPPPAPVDLTRLLPVPAAPAIALQPRPVPPAPPDIHYQQTYTDASDTLSTTIGLPVIIIPVHPPHDHHPEHHEDPHGYPHTPPAPSTGSM